MKKIRKLVVNWYNRPITKATAAKQFLEFLILLRNHNPDLFPRYCEGASSKKKALEREISLDQDSVMKLFGKKEKPDDYPEYAFDAGLWNGEIQEENEASVRVALGSAEKKLWANACIVRFPYGGPQSEYYQNPENLQVLLDLMIAHWTPESYQINGEKFPVKSKGRGIKGLFRKK